VIPRSEVLNRGMASLISRPLLRERTKRPPTSRPAWAQRSVRSVLLPFAARGRQLLTAHGEPPAGSAVAADTRSVPATGLVSAVAAGAKSASSPVATANPRDIPDAPAPG
jgi:hypothetical protein